MGHKNSTVHRGNPPGPHKPNINFRAEPDVEQAIADWCHAVGVDPAARGVRTRALTALVRAGRNALGAWWALGQTPPDGVEDVPEATALVGPPPPPAGWVIATPERLPALGETVMVRMPGEDDQPVWRVAQVSSAGPRGVAALFNGHGGVFGGGSFRLDSVAVMGPPTWAQSAAAPADVDQIPATTRSRAREVGTCPTCHREVGVTNHRGGDGTARRPRPHNGPDGEPCEGRFHTLLEWREVAR